MIGEAHHVASHFHCSPDSRLSSDHNTSFVRASQNFHVEGNFRFRAAPSEGETFFACTFRVRS